MFIPIPILMTSLLVVAAVTLHWFASREALRQSATDRMLPEDPEWQEFFRRERVERWKGTGALAGLLLSYLACLVFIASLAAPRLTPGVNDAVREPVQVVSAFVVGLGLPFLPPLVLFWWACQLWLVEPMVERRRQMLIRQQRSAARKRIETDDELARLRRRADGATN
jgi:hypothetical protein